jgi:hypothetical protein
MSIEERIEKLITRWQQNAAEYPKNNEVVGLAFKLCASDLTIEKLKWVQDESAKREEREADPTMPHLHDPSISSIPLEKRRDVYKFLRLGIYTDGDHHKQWCLVQVARILGVKMDEQHEEGIAP